MLPIQYSINYNLFFISDGKYHAMHTGELLVHNLESSDQFSSYTCQMMHTLTRKLTTSTPANIAVHGNIIITET